MSGREYKEMDREEFDAWAVEVLSQENHEIQRHVREIRKDDGSFDHDEYWWYDDEVYPRVYVRCEELSRDSHGGFIEKARWYIPGYEKPIDAARRVLPQFDWRVKGPFMVQGHHMGVEVILHMPYGWGRWGVRCPTLGVCGRSHTLAGKALENWWEEACKFVETVIQLAPAFER